MAGPQAPYQVVARRFRPTRFEEVVGQEAVIGSLERALGSGQIPHAFLLSGSRGVGKTTVARILARALNCEQGPTARPCDRCRSCTAILSGASADVVEIDAASHNLVDDIRELRERVGFASMGARYKVYILDEVHMLTRSAFNAFLKTLEEPPPGVVFVLATTEIHKVPDTVRSRCQVLLFRRVDEGDIVHRLRGICAREGVAVPDAVLEEVALGSSGGMRDAESQLERLLPLAKERGAAFDLEAYRQLTARLGAEATLEVAQALVAGDAAAALRFAAAVIEAGADEREALGELLEALRAVLLLAVDGPDSGLVRHGGKARETLLGLSRRAPRHQIEAMLQAGLIARERIRHLEDRRLVLELALLRMAEASTLPQLGELLEAARRGTLAAAPVPGSGSPPPAAAPAAPPGAADLDLRARLIARLASDSPLLAGTLEQCRIEGPDARGQVRIELATDRKLYRDRLAAEGVQQLLRAALRELAGKDVTLAIAGHPAAAPAAGPGPAPSAPVSTAPPAAPSPRRPAPPGAPVQKLVERFDGQIVGDDDLGLSEAR